MDLLRFRVFSFSIVIYTDYDVVVREIQQGFNTLYAAMGLVEEEEKPHPYLCVQHGGSPSCVESNLRHGFTCPRCDE